MRRREKRRKTRDVKFEKLLFFVEGFTYAFSWRIGLPDDVDEKTKKTKREKRNLEMMEHHHHI